MTEQDRRHTIPCIAAGYFRRTRQGIGQSVTLVEMQHRPMPLVRIPEPFDHPDWLFELKHDGFRALAYVDGHHCRLVSRRGHEFTKFGQLTEEIAHSVKTMRAVLDGEIVCLGPDGRRQFYDLLF